MTLLSGADNKLNCAPYDNLFIPCKIFLLNIWIMLICQVFLIGLKTQDQLMFVQLICSLIVNKLLSQVKGSLTGSCINSSKWFLLKKVI